MAVIFGQPQLLVVDLPYGDGEEEFAQQGNAWHHALFLSLFPSHKMHIHNIMHMHTLFSLS